MSIIFKVFPCRAAVIASISASLLVACTETTDRVAVKKSPLDAMADVFVQVSVANFIVQNCADAGIVANYATISDAISVGAAALVASGYDADAIATARLQAVRLPVSQRGDQALKYLYDRGAERGDNASLCTVGRDEMGKGTFVGSLLRVL